VRTATCIEGDVEVEAVCEPGFDYGRTPATWKLENGRHEAAGSGAGVTIGSGQTSSSVSRAIVIRVATC
jgi:hypothetical protein